MQRKLCDEQNVKKLLRGRVGRILVTLARLHVQQFEGPGEGGLLPPINETPACHHQQIGYLSAGPDRA